METVKVQDITPGDLPWKIRYDASRCTLCGSCVAACSFRAIEAKVERRRMVFSEGDFPEPKQRFSAVPVIRQRERRARSANLLRIHRLDERDQVPDVLVAQVRRRPPRGHRRARADHGRIEQPAFRPSRFQPLRREQEIRRGGEAVVTRVARGVALQAGRGAAGEQSARQH